MGSIYRRRPEDLKARASLYWPQELREQAVSTQVMTRLLETQETFVSILKVADASPTSWEQVLSGSSLAPNLFLKHLMILADVSGEILKRVTPLKQSVMQYAWQGTNYDYEFQSISQRHISSSLLKVDTKHLLERSELHPMMKDIVMCFVAKTPVYPQVPAHAPIWLNLCMPLLGLPAGCGTPLRNRAS
jgi:hypothetical protein